MTATFVGVDIVKGEFVLACRPGRGWTATSDAAGVAESEEQAAERIRTMLQHKGILFRPW